MNSLFEEFESAEEELQKANAEAAIRQKSAALQRKHERMMVRRAKSESELRDLLPAVLTPETSYHVISSGDIDALSYLAHIEAAQPLEAVFLSSWCMAMQDLDWLLEKLRTGRIGELSMCLGEIFPSQYPDEFEKARKHALAGDLTLKIARNHAKVMTGSQPRAGLWFAIESSANVNTNPRIEQTCIHTSRELHDFYNQFFSGIRSIVNMDKAA